MKREDSLPFTGSSISIVSKVWVLSFSWKMMNCSNSQQLKGLSGKVGLGWNISRHGLSD